MPFIFIDNDILIYLATGQLEDGDEILPHLEKLLNEHKIKLVINDVLLAEWERNKESKVLETLERILKSKMKSFKDLKPFLDAESITKLNDIIETTQSQVDVYRNAAKKRIECIEALFLHKYTVKYPILDEVKIKAMELALENKMPYKPNKNSTGDALHFLTCVYSLKGTSGKLYFVTNNKQDFSSPSNENELHEDLLLIAKDVNLVYSRNIGETLNLISPRTISVDTVERISQAQQRITTNRYGGAYYLDCTCGNSLDERDGIWRNGPNGLTYFLKCRKCGSLYDTGDFFD